MGEGETDTWVGLLDDEVSLPAPPRRGIWLLLALFTRLLPLVDLLGRAGQRIARLRGYAFVALGIVAAVAATAGNFQLTGIAIGAIVFLSGIAAAFAAHRTLLIGEFTTAGPTKPESGPATSVDLANLLQVELSRVARVLRVVEARRAVPGGVGAGRPLDATLSVDDLLAGRQGKAMTEAKVSIAGVSIPVEPLLFLVSRAVGAPRITGHLHCDGNMLILTAQQEGETGFTWRVTSTGDAASETWDDPRSVADDDDFRGNSVGEDAQLSALVHELALRIFTDVALGRDVRWEATSWFVRGVRRFRACLRTPKERKVNLKETERRFLWALTEDEDFPLAYYNLGVVYKELEALAQGAGRRGEEQMHQGAAETAFGRAIEQDPNRWQAYVALGNSQLARKDYESVVSLCHRVDGLNASRDARARAHELKARALLGMGKTDLALTSAHTATLHALLGLARAFLARRHRQGDETDPVPRLRELAAACATTVARCRAQVPMETTAPGASDGAPAAQVAIVANRCERMLSMAERLSPLGAEVQFEFGLRALHGGRLREAEHRLDLAARTDPSRPSYLAARALARARRIEASDSAGPTNSPGAASDDSETGGSGVDTSPTATPEVEAEHAESSPARPPGLAAITADFERALRGMASAYAPSRDAETCELLARVRIALAPRWQIRTPNAEELRAISAQVQGSLARTRSDASVSALFLDAVQERTQGDTGSPWAGAIGEYGEVTAKARACLRAGRSKLPGGNAPPPDRDKALEYLRTALASAEHATSLNPLSSLAWETLGDIHRELSDFEHAREAWGYALGRDPDNPDLYDKIGSSHWYLAFQEEHRGVVEEELREAAGYFEKALLLYDSGDFEEQLRTRYRLGKLHVALKSFKSAQPHLQVREAVEGNPPLVGWVLLGLAHLGKRNFAEAEYQFRRVIKHGEELANRTRADEKFAQPESLLVAEALDERQWPLGFTRAWGHLGYAFSLVERDGDLAKAEEHVNAAKDLKDATLKDAKTTVSEGLSELFPTRVAAACADCTGMIALKRNDVDEAVNSLKEAVALFPYSRTYLNLAMAYEASARKGAQSSVEDLRTARRLTEHYRTLRPHGDGGEAAQVVLDQISELEAAATSTRGGSTLQVRWH